MVIKKRNIKVKIQVEMGILTGLPLGREKLGEGNQPLKIILFFVE
jgi:hypothetical protein